MLIILSWNYANKSQVLSSNEIDRIARWPSTYQSYFVFMRSSRDNCFAAQKPPVRYDEMTLCLQPDDDYDEEQFIEKKPK